MKVYNWWLDGYRAEEEAKIDPIDTIENIRKTNNSLWMDILRIAMKHAPAETRTILAKIDFNDNKISSELKKL